MCPGSRGRGLLLEEAFVLAAQDLDLVLDEDDLLLERGELGLELAGVALGVLQTLVLVGDTLLELETALLRVARLIDGLAEFGSELVRVLLQGG